MEKWAFASFETEIEIFYQHIRKLFRNMKILKNVAAFALLIAFLAQNVAAQTAKDGDAAFQLGMVDKAVKIYESVVKTAPTDINAALQLGNLVPREWRTGQSPRIVHKSGSDQS